MMRRVWYGLAVLALAACGGDGTGPQAGQLNVVLNGPPARSVILRILGPITGVTAASGIQMYQEEAATENTLVILVAPQGTNLSGSTVARISVADVNAPGQYEARVLQGAGPTYVVLGSNALSASITR